MDLERELRQALTRRNPAPGFDEKVLGRIASGERVTELPIPRPRRRAYALPLAASLAIVAGGSYYSWQQQREQSETERTTRNVVLALQIASEKVSAVQTRVQEISRHDRQIQ